MSGHRSHADASGSRARGSGAHRAAAQQPTGASAGDEAAPLPAWAVEIEEQLLKTARWQALLARMADEVQDKLAHNGVAFFSDLGEDEQAAIIDQAEHALERTPALAEFRDEVADVVDKQLEAVTSQDLVNGRGTSRIDIILNRTASAAGALLHSLPGEARSARVLFNEPFPAPLRRAVWRDKLRNETAGDDYRGRLASSRASTLASRDAEVKATCDGMMESHFPDLERSARVRQTHRLLVSYLFALQPDQAGWAYWLAVPVAVVLAHDAQAPTGDASHVVEAMAAVLAAPRPRLSDKPDDRVQAFAPGVRHPTAAETANEVAMLVSDADALLADHLAAQGGGLNEAVTALLQPLIEQLGVGVLSLDCALFVWDQCVLLGWADVLPLYAAACLLAMRREIKAATTWQQLSQEVAESLLLLPSSQLSSAFEQHFGEQFRAERGITRQRMAGLRRATQSSSTTPAPGAAAAAAAALAAGDGDDQASSGGTASEAQQSRSHGESDRSGSAATQSARRSQSVRESQSAREGQEAGSRDSPRSGTSAPAQ